MNTICRSSVMDRNELKILDVLEKVILLVYNMSGMFSKLSNQDILTNREDI